MPSVVVTSFHTHPTLWTAHGINEDATATGKGACAKIVAIIATPYAVVAAPLTVHRNMFMGAVGARNIDSVALGATNSASPKEAEKMAVKPAIPLPSVRTTSIVACSLRLCLCCCLCLCSSSFCEKTRGEGE